MRKIDCGVRRPLTFKTLSIFADIVQSPPDVSVSTSFRYRAVQYPHKCFLRFYEVFMSDSALQYSGQQLQWQCQFRKYTRMETITPQCSGKTIRRRPARKQPLLCRCSIRPLPVHNPFPPHVRFGLLKNKCICGPVSWYNCPKRHTLRSNAVPTEPNPVRQTRKNLPEWCRFRLRVP